MFRSNPIPVGTVHQNRHHLPDGRGIHQTALRKRRQEAASDGPALNVQRFVGTANSEHIINTLDAQPIIDAVSSQLTFIIQVPGTVNFQDNPTERFQKITAQDDKWKFASDCFRLQDAIF
ncbi:AAEL011628-PA [Aedes aegypti]|uniref:AAEL011628-PA n=1 Tax=Aedes aegypti TaxID=7159 RepID=Q16PI1_AEDAE|nr:AAEL011628-PA [Aedes aegypti]